MRCPNHTDNRHLAAKVIGACGDCLRTGRVSIRQAITYHKIYRTKETLIPEIPTEGMICSECGNHCRIDDGSEGYCGQYISRDGNIISKHEEKVVVSWYYDPLPTNCVAEWVCQVLNTKRENQKNNLAIFYGSCNSDCFYCQNNSYRRLMAQGSPLMAPTEVANSVNHQTACVCFFGGDPACNVEHSIESARILRREHDIKVCYETNGNISTKWLDKMVDVVMRSEGVIKIDLKAHSPKVYTALTGSTNKMVLKNFTKLASLRKQSHDAFLVASILLVPSYVDSEEIRLLCEFIASCDSGIPTAFLGYAPHHYMRDLPRTSRAHAKRAYEIAREAGLENIQIGNIGLLSDVDYHIG